jgi:hypothetical protein
MTKVQTILGDFLRGAGALKPVRLGESERAITVTEEERQALFARLQKQSVFNNRIVIAVTVIHFALFVLAIGLVYYYRESFNAVIAILGGSVLSLLAITKSLTGLWREKWMIDILVSTLPNLTPDQALAFVKTLYYSQQSPQPRQPGPQQTAGDS